MNLKRASFFGRQSPVLSFLAGTLFVSCMPSEPGKKVGPISFAWDTTIVVDRVSLSSASQAVARSQVLLGDPGRLAAFFQKCRVGGEIRIGFIGGSITAGASATSPAERYSTLFCGFLGKLFPKARFIEINAGIGATDSRYGSSRVGTDLIRYSPDLYVVEFANNDNYLDTLFAKSITEGVIRQCMGTSSPVLLFHTMNRAGDSLNQHLQKDLARHYGLPVVSYLEGIRPSVNSGSLNLDSILADNVHPTNRGHLQCAYMLYSFFKRESIEFGEDSLPIPILPTPLVTDLYERAGLWGGGDTAITLSSVSGWTRDTSDLGRVEFTAGIRNARLELKCRVNEFTIGFWKRKEHTGVVAVSLDGKDVDTLRAEFPEDWGGGYLGLKKIFTSTDLEEHKIGFRLLSGDTLELKAFLYAGK